MPSQRHEVIVELLRRSPDLIVQLFARVAGSAAGSYRAELHSESFSQVKASPHAADLVLKLMDGDTLRLGVVGEVQLDVDAGKLFSWPLYGVGLRAELQCETCVLVITPSGRVARWAAQPHPPRRRQRVPARGARTGRYSSSDRSRASLAVAWFGLPFRTHARCRPTRNCSQNRLQRSGGSQAVRSPALHGLLRYTLLGARRRCPCPPGDPHATRCHPASK